MSATLNSGQLVKPTSKQAARILVVDDEQGVRRVVTTALTRAGYAVHAAANASQAIATCESESFDLVLSDVIMPGMNGHELAQWVAMNHPKTQMALMTGYDATCQGHDASPCCSRLAKPFLPKDLVSFVARVLSEETTFRNLDAL
jgi:two-component system cell cycle response regulator CpdR